MKFGVNLSKRSPFQGTAIAAACLSALSTCALLGSAKPAQAYWTYSYSGTGKLSLSGAWPDMATHAWRFNSYLDFNPSNITGDFNPSFSYGNGAFTNDYLVLASGTYSELTDPDQTTTIDSSATPSVPVVTVTATWVPNPTSDTNNDSVINDLDDPAPATAPTPTLRLNGYIGLQSGRMDLSSARAHVKVCASYQTSSSTWVPSSTGNIDSPSYPYYDNNFNDSNTVNTTASAYSYSGGVAVYKIRVDEMTLHWDGSLNHIGQGSYGGNIRLIFP